MADSNITKRALASALKALMQDAPFAKIGVSDICEKCGMNRKSFYYHFQDKYELVNWIFDMDFIDLVNRYAGEDSVAGWVALGQILYDNRRFYCNALSVQGQNSLSEHIHEIAAPIFKAKLTDACIKDNSFFVDFFIDSLINAMLRWIRDADCDPPEKFLPGFLNCISALSRHIQRKYEESAP